MALKNKITKLLNVHYLMYSKWNKKIDDIYCESTAIEMWKRKWKSNELLRS